MYYKDKDIKLINGCCIETMDKMISKNIKIDLLCVDPDYPTTSRGNAGNSGGMLQEKNNMKGMVFGLKAPSIEEWLPRVDKLLKDNSHMYIMCNDKNLNYYHNVITKQGFKIFKTLIWVKDNKIMGQYYMGQKEYIIFARKGKAKKINNCGSSDVLIFPNKKPKDKNGKNIHNTPKPVELMKVLIENSTDEGDIVLDFMCGIGSTLIASKELGRKCIGIELNEDYCSYIKDNLLGSNSNE